MEDLRVEDLLDDINTDAMTPAWVCFDHRPEDIARNAYAGLIVGRRAAVPRGRADGRQLRGHRLRATARASAPRARPRRRPRSGRASASRSPPRSRRSTPATTSTRACYGRPRDARAAAGGRGASRSREFTQGYDPITQLIIEHGGLFPFTKAFARGEVALPAPATPPRPMTMAEKILAAPPGRRATGAVFVKPGDAVVRARRRRLLPRVHHRAGAPLPRAGVRRRTTAWPNPRKFAVFEDHLIYADGVPRWRRSRRRSRPCATCSASSSGTPACATTRRRTASRPASATRSRASRSSSRATSSRPPTATPAWAAR